MQSRYYNPTIGRFINADMYASTGQGFVGNNMFAYCLNNPVAYSDSQGTDARTCLSADGAIDGTPWWDHSPSGGGVIYNYKTKDPDYSGDKFLTQIALRHIGNGLEWLYDAYMRGYDIQQNTQMQEAQLMLNGAIDAYSFLDETGAISDIKWGTNTVNAAIHGKIALTYLAAPIPTPIDEYFAACHAAKAVYCLFMAGMEVFQ